MSALIRMSSGDFLKKFTKEFDYKDYRFLLISEDIKTKKHKNVYPLKCLIPPTNAVSEFVANGFSEKYVKKYSEYLARPKTALLIATIVRMVVAEHRNVVLLCSDKEDEFKYIKVLSDFIHATYGVKVFSYKKYSKNPEKCENIKYKKKFIAELDDTIEKLSKEAENDVYVKDYVVEQFSNASKKELIAFCKENSIKVKKDDNRKKIVKRILKEIYKK